MNDIVFDDRVMVYANVLLFPVHPLPPANGCFFPPSTAIFCLLRSSGDELLALQPELVGTRPLRAFQRARLRSAVHHAAPLRVSYYWPIAVLVLKSGNYSSLLAEPGYIL